MSGACAKPIPFGTLVEYWFGELTGETEQQVEEHFLGCASCSAQLEALSALHRDVRAAFEKGAIHAVISAPFLAAMKERGMRLREYPVAPGGSVQCTITPADDAVIGRLKAPLTGVRRIDVVCQDEAGGLLFRLDDVPFDRAMGEVLICPAAAALKQMPAHTERLQLLAVEDGTERTIGDYSFFHTPG